MHALCGSLAGVEGGNWRSVGRDEQESEPEEST